MSNYYVVPLLLRICGYCSITAVVPSLRNYTPKRPERGRHSESRLLLLCKEIINGETDNYFVINFAVELLRQLLTRPLWQKPGFVFFFKKIESIAFLNFFWFFFKLNRRSFKKNWGYSYFYHVILKIDQKTKIKCRFYWGSKRGVVLFFEN